MDRKLILFWSNRTSIFRNLNNFCIKIGIIFDLLINYLILSKGRWTINILILLWFAILRLTILMPWSYYSLLENETNIHFMLHHWYGSTTFKVRKLNFISSKPLWTMCIVPGIFFTSLLYQIILLSSTYVLSMYLFLIKKYDTFFPKLVKLIFAKLVKTNWFAYN